MPRSTAGSVPPRARAVSAVVSSSAVASVARSVASALSNSAIPDSGSIGIRPSLARIWRAYCSAPSPESIPAMPTVHSPQASECAGRPAPRRTRAGASSMLFAAA